MLSHWAKDSLCLSLFPNPTVWLLLLWILALSFFCSFDELRLKTLKISDFLVKITCSCTLIIQRLVQSPEQAMSIKSIVTTFENFIKFHHHWFILHKYFWSININKAGYTANTSRGRVGRGGDAGFSTFRLVLTNGPTDRRTDGRTDKASYRVARPRLKTELNELSELKCLKTPSQMSSYANKHVFLYLHAHTNINTLLYWSFTKS